MLDALIVTSRLLLAAVFVVAAVAKLADREGTRQAVVAFGAPDGVAERLAPLLPLAELAVALLLLPAATALAGALGALGLLLLFSAAIAVNLARGHEPECHCFGQLHSAPAGPRTLARNGALAGVAVLAVAGTLAGSDASALAWIGRLHGAEIAAVAIATVVAALLVTGAMAYLSLLRSYGRLLLRLEQAEQALADAGLEVEEPAPKLGLEPGTPAPAFSVPGSAAAEVSLDELLAPGLPLMLLFASPRCGPCQALLPEVAMWQTEHADRLTLAVASDGAPEDVRAEAEELGLEGVLVDQDGAVYDAFQATGTPSAVLIAADGTIASDVESGRDAIEALLEGVLDAPLPVGSHAPALELGSLEGASVKLAERRGRETLLLFWNPGCGFCRAMHEDVLAWESSANGNRPRLLVVSSGDEASTRAEGFGSEVLLDSQFAAGHAFGATGTPTAVLLGADGRIASDVVAGADEVLALAGGQNGSG